MTEAERRAALEQIAAEIRVCNRCRLHQGRTQAVPGEGHPSTEVMFVGEGPGFNEDRLGRPFVGRAGDLLVRHLGSIGWRRDEVFITNVVKCRPPDNRDPEPDEIAACAPFLKRQLEVLDPALIVTLGRHSMARFMPGARISQAHGTVRPADPQTGARDATVFAMYHPAAALRSTDVERQSYEDVGRVPQALEEARRRRADRPTEPAAAAAASDDASIRAVPHDSPPNEPASVSPPVLTDTETNPRGPQPEGIGRTRPEHSFGAASPGPVGAAIALGSGAVDADTPTADHPRDVPSVPAVESTLYSDQPSTLRESGPGVSLDANDPSDQLPLF